MCYGAATPPNNSFKPNLLRSGNGVAEKACHAVTCTAQVGLTQAFGRMRTSVAIALFLSTSAALPADDQRMQLVQPKGATLVLTKLVRTNDLFATFSGQVWVTGTVIGRWSTGATNMADKKPDYLLVPDTGAVNQLPYFVLREPPYFNQYKVRSIELLNGAQALRIAAGEEQVRRLLERRVNHVRVNGRFLIDQYVVGVECDAPWAKALLLKAELPEQSAKFNAVQEGC